MRRQRFAGHKSYIISLNQTRSVVAFVAGTGVFICTLAAIFFGLQNTLPEEESLLHYFTVNANLLSAAGAAFMIPYAVAGIRRKQFVLPKWVVLFQYCGAVCVTITMLASLFIIIPTQGIAQGATGMNFWLHIITPVLTVVLFQCVESGVSFTRRDTVLVQIPYWAYMAVYYVMVILVGKENGGWEDIYMVTVYLPLYVVIPGMAAAGWAVAAVLRVVQNRRTASHRRELSAQWSREMSPVDLKIEAFGLGRYMGQHCTESELAIPLEIFELMTEKYDITLTELTRAFVKGALDSIEEKRDGTKQDHHDT